MARPKTGRSPIITIRLLCEERERFDASIPAGQKITEVGRERLSIPPDPSTWDEAEARKPLNILARGEFVDTSAETRAIWLREALFPGYQAVEEDEMAITGQRKTGKRGRKSATYAVVGGKTVETVRDRKVKVVISQDDYDTNSLIAEALGITLNTYCRRVLMEEPVFAFETHMGVDAVVRHAEGALAIKHNGLEAELSKAAERLTTKEAERIVRAAAREYEQEKNEDKVIPARGV